MADELSEDGRELVEKKADADGYRYDVAVSFLSADEATARELTAALSGFLDPSRIFYYADRQETLVGEDLQALRLPYRSESRVVVVLYRAGWGQTDWTRVEEDAIKDRWLRTQAGTFLTVAGLAPPERPGWYPESSFYLDFPRLGQNGLVSVILHQIAESGGQVRRESPMEMAARITAKNQGAERLRALRQREGMQRLLAAGADLFDALEVQQAALAETAIGQARFWRSDHQAFLSIDDTVLSVGFEIPAVNAGTGCSLRVGHVGGVEWLGGRPRARHELETMAKWTFHYHPHSDGEWLWGNGGSWWSTESLAEEVGRILLECFDKPPRRNRGIRRGLNWLDNRR